MAIEVSQQRIDNIHAPEHLDRLVDRGKLAIVAEHAHDVVIAVLIGFAIFLERTFPHIVERDELGAFGNEISARDHWLAIARPQIGFLGGKSRQLENARSHMLG